MGLPRPRGLLGRGGAGLCAAGGAGLAAEAASLLGGRHVLFLAAAGAGFLAPMVHLVDRGPGSAFGLLLGSSSALVGVLDVLGLAFLLGRVSRLVSAWHFEAPQ